MGASRQTWFKICLRAVAVTNIAVALIGLYDVQVAIAAFPTLKNTTERYSVPTDFPYQAEAFHAMATISILFLVALLPCSYYVWRAHPRGCVLSNVVYVSEVAYWILSGYGVNLALRWVSDRGQMILGSVAVTNGLGILGLLIQFRASYPLIALVLVNLSYRGLLAAPAETAS